LTVDAVGGGDTAPGGLTADELAELAGVDPARVRDDVAHGTLTPGEDGRFQPGDVHRVRVMQAFEDAGIPLDALRAGQEAGMLSFLYYDRLHAAVPPLSRRTLAQVVAALGDAAPYVEPLFAAFGIARPEPTARLSIEDEAIVTRLAPAVANAPQPDLALRALRLFAEALRRASEAALSTYQEAVRRTGPAANGISGDAYQAMFGSWTTIAGTAPDLARWLTSRHLSRAIDDFSVTSTEEILARAGYIARRTDAPPAVAFVDLSGFTKLVQEIGDEPAAGLALQLADLATELVPRHDGRVVKLLGDGVLARFPDAASATDATLELLDALPAAGLPTGHAGVNAGPLIARDGDVFGRTVNSAARIADVAPDGRLYATLEVASSLPPERFALQRVEPTPLQGIGIVDLADVRRR
jgi:adenylate cyclase